jgi:hypothetical protein
MNLSGIVSGLAGGFSKWLNETSMPSLGSFNSQLLWAAGSLTLTLANYQLLLSDSSAAREAGLGLAAMLLGAWTGKSYLNYKSNQSERDADPNVIGARGQAAAVAASAAPAPAPAVQVGTAQVVDATAAVAPASVAQAGTVTVGPPEKEWTVGDKQAGVV